MSEDHGKDLSSVNSLLNKHHQLEQDIHSHKEKVTDVQDAAQVRKVSVLSLTSCLFFFQSYILTPSISLSHPFSHLSVFPVPHLSVFAIH